MKNKKRNIVIIISLITAGILLFVGNAFYGNPISKKIAEKAAKEYIYENYANQNLKIDDVVYNLKMGDYIAFIVSETSMDTHFTLDISMNGKVQDDTYDEVVSGWNTYSRLDSAYRNLVDSLFEDPKFPLQSEIDFGELKTIEDSRNDHDTMEYGITLATLERDKEYDIKELAKSTGHITFYAKDEEVSLQKASELLLLLKSELDQAEIPFYAIDFVLEQPRKDDEPINEDAPRIEIGDFLYSDIYKEGLEERIKEAHEKLSKYYEIQDALYKKKA